MSLTACLKAFRCLSTVGMTLLVSFAVPPWQGKPVRKPRARNLTHTRPCAGVSVEAPKAGVVSTEIIKTQGKISDLVSTICLVEFKAT